MDKIPGNGAFHYSAESKLVVANSGATGAAPTFWFSFQTFGNPFVGDLITKLNATSLDDMLDPGSLGTLKRQYADDYTTLSAGQVTVDLPDAGLDTSPSGPNGPYNWELTYFIPVTVAVHLSNNQRFAEAKSGFTGSSTRQPGWPSWKSYVFQNGTMANIAELIALLSTPDGQLAAALVAKKHDVINGYSAILASPYQPHPWRGPGRAPSSGP